MTTDKTLKELAKAWVGEYGWPGVGHNPELTLEFAYTAGYRAAEKKTKLECMSAFDDGEQMEKFRVIEIIKALKFFTSPSHCIPDNYKYACLALKQYHNK